MGFGSSFASVYGARIAAEDRAAERVDQKIRFDAEQSAIAEERKFNRQMQAFNVVNEITTRQARYQADSLSVGDQINSGSAQLVAARQALQAATDRYALRSSFPNTPQEVLAQSAAEVQSAKMHVDDLGAHLKFLADNQRLMTSEMHNLDGQRAAILPFLQASGMKIPGASSGGGDAGGGAVAAPAKQTSLGGLPGMSDTSLYHDGGELPTQSAIPASVPAAPSSAPQSKTATAGSSIAAPASAPATSSTTAADPMEAFQRSARNYGLPTGRIEGGKITIDAQTTEDAKYYVDRVKEMSQLAGYEVPIVVHDIQAQHEADLKQGSALADKLVSANTRLQNTSRSYGLAKAAAAAGDKATLASMFDEMVNAAKKEGASPEEIEQANKMAEIYALPVAQQAAAFDKAKEQIDSIVTENEVRVNKAKSIQDMLLDELTGRLGLNKKP